MLSDANYCKHCGAPHHGTSIIRLLVSNASLKAMDALVATGICVHRKTADEDNAETQSSLRSAEKTNEPQMSGRLHLRDSFLLLATA
jgi:NMD protein affecting ribosome stability and mRNA decay